jgi:PTS system nitrogen regulatory IIA component
MGVEELAAYLRRDAREVGKMASRGYLPGRKVGGEWRFARAEINQWIETQLHGYTADQLTALEAGVEDRPFLGEYLSERCVAVPLAASTKASVLRELVKLAEQSWAVYDANAVHDAIKAREEMGSTAFPNGVAIPHPRRPLPNAVGESLIAYARLPHGVPFGAERGVLTDIFFLVCCRDDRIHLQVLARLTRLLNKLGFLDTLRASESADESRAIILAGESELVGG